MKLARKIIALVIVLCTVGAMMIPGVSAAKTVATTYDLIATRNALGIGTSWMFASNYDAWKTIMNAYTAETPTSNWMLDSTTAMQGKFGTKINNTYPLYFQVKNTMSTNLLGMAFRVKAPATGNFTLNVNYMQGVDALLFREAGAYVWEAPEAYYDEANKAYYASGSAWSVLNGGNSAYTVAKGLADAGEAPVVTFAPYNADATAYTAVDAIGETQFALTEGKEYIIYIYGVNSAEVAAELSGNAIMYFSSFELVQHIEEAPETPWDPSANTDLVVDFVDTGDYDITDNAGITTGSWISSNAAQRAKLDAAYASGLNNWTFYTNNGTAVHSVYSTKNYTPGYLQIYSSEKTAEFNTYGYLPILFKAPGTGSYTLSVTDSAVKWANNVDVSAHVFKVPAEGFTTATLKNLANATDPLFTYNPTVDKEAVATEKTFYSDPGVVQLEGGEDYVLVLGIKAAASQQCAFIRGFALTEVKPEASINGTDYATLTGALTAAVSGDTIKLQQNVTADEVSLLAGVTLNLNGKTLTTGAIAGTVIDSADGAGLIAIEKEAAAISAGAGQIALWDNNQNGYRVFTYDFKTYEAVAGNDDISGVDKNIHFYDVEYNYLVPVSDRDADGRIKRGFGDKRFGENSAEIKKLYDENEIHWHYLLRSNTYYVRPGGPDSFSWGNESMYQFGAGYTALVLRSPGEGKINVTLTTDESHDAIFDVYFVELEEIKTALGENYGAYTDAVIADPYSDNAATAEYKAYKAAIDAAIKGDTPAIVGGNGKYTAYTGSFEFKADTEYVMVYNVTGGNLKSYYSDLTFKRAEHHGEVQTFWSDVEFTNDAAYQYLPTAGLQVGFKMSTVENPAADEDFKFYQLDDATVAAWADAESINKDDTNWGFYIRVSGFEALTENTTVTCVPYININNETITADPVTYNFVVAE